MAADREDLALTKAAAIASGILRRNAANTAWELRKDKLGASVSPAVGNDNTEGYSVGSFWFDTTTSDLFICEDASTGAAVWLGLVTNQGSDMLTAATPVVGAESGNVRAVQVEVRTLDGTAKLAVERLLVVISDSEYAPAPSGTATAALTGGGDGVILEGSGTSELIVTTAAGNARVDLDVTQTGAKTVYLHVQTTPGGGLIKPPAGVALAFTA